MPPRNIYELLEQTAARYGQRNALYSPVPGKGETKYQIYTWEQYRDAVAEIAVGLYGLGIRRGDMVALYADTRVDFYLTDVGIMAVGAVSAALYVAYPFPDQVRTLRAFGAKLVFCEDPKSLKAMKEAAGPDAPYQWVLMTGEAEGVLTLSQLRAQGREAMDADPELLRRVVSAVQPEDEAILYMTSGATGEPKMGIVTHKAMLSNLESAAAVLKLTPEDRSIVFLPSAHITQRLGLELLPIGYGMPVWFSESLSKLPGELRRVKPTFFIAPPRLWERIYTSICAEVKKQPVYTQRLFWTALGAGIKASHLRQSGQPIPAWLSLTLKVADRVVFQKIRDRFGGQMRLPISGSAPLAKDLATFYEAIGMTIVEGYGLTEGGITCLNPFDAVRIGSIGKPLPGIEAKISPEGELLLKGGCLFSGYFNDPVSTAQVLQDGWLHTGDIAEIDREGYIYITGRKKEVIVASNGKKIYPTRIEGLFKTEPLINQVILIGDKLPFVSALFTVNPQIATTLNGMEPHNGRSSAEIMTADPVQAEVKKVVAKINKQLAPFEQIRKFRLLEHEFSVDRGELTPTMKVRRSKVLENYRTMVNELYAGKEEFL